jgi:hypothetical protein
MSRTIKNWTITSPNGQTLNGNWDSIDPETVLISSEAGNHGSVTQAAWGEKIKQMESAGYKIALSETIK